MTKEKMPEGMKEKLEKNKHKDTCPECGGKNIGSVHERCLCGGNCWTAPYCEDCGFTGIGNSTGGAWYKWWWR